MGRSTLVTAALGAMCACGGRYAGPAPLTLEKTIPLDGVAGRIDHLAYDPKERRLFVAELGNGTVEAIDLATAKSVARIAGLNEPQGVAWLPQTRELAIASGDGSVRFYDGDRFQPTAAVAIGKDADNLRVDPASGKLVVGFGNGALARIDPRAHTVVDQLRLPAHPESFRIDGDVVYVNLPGDGSIVAGNLRSGMVTARWSTGLRRLNFPMALDSPGHTLAIAFRLPARLILMSIPSGAFRQALPTCGDSDDLFFNADASLLYVVCGSGEIDTYWHDQSAYVRVASVSTRPGARTGLFVPQEDRLFVAARAQGDSAAVLMVFRPVPQPVSNR